MARTKPRHNEQLCKLKRRCNKCRKLAKDKIGEEYLCRIHSPMRRGYNG